MIDLAADEASEPSPKNHLEPTHRDIRGGGVRAAIFGINDGLVSNAALVLGVDGAHPSTAVVRLAGIAGMLAGAFSMAAGEYVSMRAQAELLAREIELEAIEIRESPLAERTELSLIYERRGLDPDVALELATAMMETPERALEAHARDELGIDPEQLGSPLVAACASCVSFAVGALVPLAGFLWAGGGTALLVALLMTAVTAVTVGIAVSFFAATSRWRSAVRQLAICSAAVGVSFLVGSLVGLSGAGRS